MEAMYSYATDLGRITLAENGTAITHLFFAHTPVPPHVSVRETALLGTAIRQLREYFGRERQVFELPLAPQGTDFQRKVWNALLDIPYGRTVSYKRIAEAVGQPQAFRAVGMANNKNPLPIFIPCHRVIGTNGKLVGYGGGMDIKVRLLLLEQWI